MASPWAPIFYEVLDYDLELVIHDARGKTATCTRRERIQPLQDRLLGYQDVVWGDGDVLHAYSANLGRPVHVLARGDRRHLLLWFPQPLQRREVATIEVAQTLTDCFLGKKDWHEITVRHFTHRVAGRFVFPRRRAPQSVRVTYRPPGSSPVHQVRCRLQELANSRIAASWEKWYPIVGSTLRTEWSW
jgi:hypothetical protein